jgi:dGTPase
VVDELEERYPDFNGLNLTFETREGILKHCSLTNAKALEAVEPGGVAARFIHHTQPSLEAQLCNLADEIAYNAHDIDDGVRSGLITLEQLEAVPLFDNYRREVLKEHPAIGEQDGQQRGRRLLYESIRRMLSDQVYDVIAETQARLAQSCPQSADDVRGLPPQVAFSAGMREQSTTLKRFLFHNLYRHAQVMETMARARQVIADLFKALCDAPQEMKPGHAAKAAKALTAGDTAKVVADYIAGMTDRYAISEHARLTGKNIWM